MAEKRPRDDDASTHDKAGDCTDDSSMAGSDGESEVPKKPRVSAEAPGGGAGASFTAPSQVPHRTPGADDMLDVLDTVPDATEALLPDAESTAKVLKISQRQAEVYRTDPEESKRVLEVCMSRAAVQNLVSDIAVNRSIVTFIIPDAGDADHKTIYVTSESDMRTTQPAVVFATVSGRVDLDVLEQAAEHSRITQEQLGGASSGICVEKAVSVTVGREVLDATLITVVMVLQGQERHPFAAFKSGGEDSLFGLSLDPFGALYLTVAGADTVDYSRVPCAADAIEPGSGTQMRDVVTHMYKGMCSDGISISLEKHHLIHISEFLKGKEEASVELFHESGLGVLRVQASEMADSKKIMDMRFQRAGKTWARVQGGGVMGAEECKMEPLLDKPWKIRPDTLTMFLRSYNHSHVTMWLTSSGRFKHTILVQVAPASAGMDIEGLYGTIICLED